MSHQNVNSLSLYTQIVVSVFHMERQTVAFSSVNHELADLWRIDKLTCILSQKADAFHCTKKTDVQHILKTAG